MKKIKTYSTNPELCVVGAKCHVSMPSKWIGAYEAAERGENIVWIPAKIIKVEPSKTGNNYPCICVYLRASQKYHTVNMENLMILPSQVETSIRFR
jgi:hypothetical protein